MRRPNRGGAGLCGALAVILAACGGKPQDAAPPAPPGLSWMLGQGDAEGYRLAAGERSFVFPADHGPHDGYRNEWWYVTGNLQSAAGRRFGYELTLFRFALSPRPLPETSSAFTTHHVMVGHLALTDVDNGRFRNAERASRDAAGLAGAGTEPVRVWLYDWSLRWRPAADSAGSGIWQLQATDDDLQLLLTLAPARAPVLQGQNGLSQKAAEPGHASWYYSVPRLETSGRIALDGESFDVTGLSWLDREWSSATLAPGQQGWDWFALQLDDGTDLMYYQLRRTDGSRDEHSAGTLMPATGAATSLAADAVGIEVLDTWDSPAGGTYPAEWRLAVPAARIDLNIRPLLAAQELDAVVRYWEGAVEVSGTRGTAPVNGRGYVELTGYAAARRGTGLAE